MEQFASYLKSLPKSPLIEAVKSLYESTNPSQYDPKVLEMYDTLVSYVKNCMTDWWATTLSEMKKFSAFKFQCNLGECMPSLYINFLYEKPMFEDDPDAIEIVTKQPVLVEIYSKRMRGEDADSMKDEVSSIILKLLEENKEYILDRLSDMCACDISENTDMGKTTLLWNLDDILSNYYTPDYKQMPFIKFATQYMDKTPEDALKELAETIEFHGGTVKTEDRPYSGGALEFDHYKQLAKLAADKKLTTAQVINYMTGVYNIGNYQGCSRIIQLNNGMLYRDGYVYDRDAVKKALDDLYDTTFYEDAVETWNDHDYRRESLMHELRGNRYPLPREHRVHRLRNGEAPDFKQWMSSPNEAGKRPIDTVLDQLKASGNAKKVKSGSSIDWLANAGDQLPAVD